MNFASLFLCAAFLSTVYLVNGSAQSEASKNGVHVVAKDFLWRIIRAGFTSGQEINEFVGSVLPSYPDPMPLEDIFIQFPETGNLSVPSGNLLGLANLTDELTITQIDDLTTSLHLRADLPHVQSNGIYESDMFYFDYITFVGSGWHEITLLDLFITLDLNLHLDEATKTTSVSGVVIKFGFADMTTWMDNILMNGEIADWLNPEIQRNFPHIVHIMMDENMPAWAAEAEVSLNAAVEGCIWEEIVAGDLTCTGLIEDDTTTTEPSLPESSTTAEPSTSESSSTVEPSTSESSSSIEPSTSESSSTNEPSTSEASSSIEPSTLESSSTFETSTTEGSTASETTGSTDSEPEPQTTPNGAVGTGFLSSFTIATLSLCTMVLLI